MDISLDRRGGHSACLASDGGYVFTATTWGSFGRRDVFLIKVNEDGDSLWGRSWGGVDEDASSCVQLTTDGGYIIFGSSASFGGGWILKTDSDGDTLWTRIYEDYGFSFGQQTEDGGYIMTGLAFPYGPTLEIIFLIKTDSLGYAGVEEQPVTSYLSNWEVVNPIGREVVLRYYDKPGGFHAKIYDASGKKCDECNSNLTSSSIRWGQNVPRGVYFIREESEHPTIQKVILVR